MCANYYTHQKIKHHETVKSAMMKYGAAVRAKHWHTVNWKRIMTTRHFTALNEVRSMCVNAMDAHACWHDRSLKCADRSLVVTSMKNFLMYGFSGLEWWLTVATHKMVHTRCSGQSAAEYIERLGILKCVICVDIFKPKILNAEEHTLYWKQWGLNASLYFLNLEHLECHFTRVGETSPQLNPTIARAK